MSILTKRCAVATFVISTIIVSDVIGQRYVSAISKSAESSGFAFTDADTVRGHLTDVMRELEYPDAVANEFVNMVSDWKDIKGRPALVAYSSILTRSQEACKRGQISGSQLAEIEEGITKELGECIRKEVSYKRNHFDLADVIQGERANCLGYSQIFYVLGNSIRLSVHAIRVTPGHIANIVDLSDETMTVVDLTRAHGFISERIITESEFEGRGSRWRLADKNNLVREDKTIHILDKNELVGEIYFCRGTICYLSSQGSTAIPHYNRAIELNPASAKAYNNRGGAYLALGEQAKAVSDFNKALELNPEYASAYQNLANAYLDSGQHTAAVTDYTKAIECDPGFAKAYFGRGFAHLALEEYKLAVSDYTKAIELNPELARAYYMRAICRAYMGQDEKARRDMILAIELDHTLREDAKQISAELELNLNLL